MDPLPVSKRQRNGWMSSDVSVTCHSCGNALDHAHTSLPGGCGGLFEELGLPPLDQWNGMKAIDFLPRLQHAVSELEDEDQRAWYKGRHDADVDYASGGWSRVDF